MTTAGLLRALGTLAALALACSVWAQGDTWTARAPMPTTRYALSVATLDGLVYAAGGSVGSCSDLATLEAYDPATDAWTTLAPMPTARAHLGTAVVDGVLYAIGGTNFCGNHYAVVEAYDPQTGTWTPRAPMPAARAQARAVVVDGKIYVLGGKAPGHVSSASTFRYDPAADTWVALPDAPTARGAHAAAAIGPFVYVMGGDEGQTSVDVFDTATNAWSVLGASFGPRPYASATSMDDGIHVIGGFGAEKRHDVFDGAAFATRADLPVSRSEHAAVVANGVLHVIGGFGDGAPRNTVLAYTPPEINRPPVADAGTDRSLPAGESCTADVLLDGSGSSDADGDALAFSWSGSFGTATGMAPMISLPSGTHDIVLTVSDGAGGIDSDDVRLTVLDATPPSVAASAFPSVIWPPDHRMVDVALTAQGIDACGAASCRILAVASNEPVDGNGDGQTQPDWILTGELTLQVRAERSGGLSGRVYTMTLVCTDTAGNSAVSDVTVTVPHDSPT